jgi:hypothetical protein
VDDCQCGNITKLTQNKKKRKKKKLCLEGVDFFSNFSESEKKEQMKEGERKQGK